MAEVFPGFEHRPGQVSMMKRVARALNEGEQVIVEAGTGIGKSIAYLLPAIVFALENSTPVVVSTNTINLQEQLMSKDIPDLLRVLGKAKHAAGRFGSADRPAEGTQQLPLPAAVELVAPDPGLPWDEARFLLRLLLWVNTTTTGDRAELNLNRAEMDLWPRACASEDNCVTTRCAYYPGGCFLYRARQMAQGAHVIVVNHALLLSDLAKSGSLLPEYRRLIVDEAHRLEEEATDQLGFEISDQDIHDCLDQFSDKGGLGFRIRGHLRNATVTASGRRSLTDRLKVIQDRAKSARGRAGELVEALGSFVQSSRKGWRGEYESNLRITGAVRGQPKWTEVELVWENFDLEMANVEKDVGDLHAVMDDLPDGRSPDMIGLLGEMSSLRQRVRTLRTQMESVISSPDAKAIYWIVLNPQYGLSLHAAPLHVGEPTGEAPLLPEGHCGAHQRHSEHGRRLRLCQELPGVGRGGGADRRAAVRLCEVDDDLPAPGYPGAGQGRLSARRRGGAGGTVPGNAGPDPGPVHLARRPAHGVQGRRSRLGEEGILVLGQGLDGSPRKLLARFKDNPDVAARERRHSGRASTWLVRG